MELKREREKDGKNNKMANVTKIHNLSQDSKKLLFTNNNHFLRPEKSRNFSLKISYSAKSLLFGTN